MPKGKDAEPITSQVSFFSIIDSIDPDEPLEPLNIFDPEAPLGRVHIAMQKRRRVREPIVDRDISREVKAQWDALLKLWGVPTDAEKKQTLLNSFEEAIRFLQILPFRGTTAMDFLTNHELTPEDITELRAVLAGRYEVFADLEASEGFRRYGTEAAYYWDQATEPKTPKRYLKKR